MIDDHAFVHPTADIAPDVTIGPWSYIGAHVKIGAATVVEPHVVIREHVTIGSANHIYQFASIGEAPQHTAYKGEPTKLIIGDHNLIREYVSIHRGTEQGNGETTVGDHNFFMCYSHVAHDCKVGNHNVFANNASIAGHVTVGSHVVLGGFTGIHQFCHIGDYCFIGRAAKIVQDIVPYMIVAGNPGGPVSTNVVGLRRHKFSREDIASIKLAYKYMFREGRPQKEVIAYLKQQAETVPVMQPLLDMMQNSQRGIAKAGVEE